VRGSLRTAFFMTINFAPLRFAIDPSGRARSLYFSSLPATARQLPHSSTDLDRPPPVNLKRPGQTPSYTTLLFLASDISLSRILISPHGPPPI
jgi:hypothetical protein